MQASEQRRPARRAPGCENEFYTLDGEFYTLDDEIAEQLGAPRAHVALAWLWRKAPVVSPIIGATKISHIEDAVAALSVRLSDKDMAYLEEPYAPHRVVGAL